MINLLATIPTGFTLTAPPPDKAGKIMATPAQQAVADDLLSHGIEFLKPIGNSATRSLFTVYTNTDYATLVTLISKYSLPIHILHAQDAHAPVQSVTDPLSTIPPTPLTPKVYKQGTHSTLINYMSDVVTYDPVTRKETSRVKATVVSIGIAGGHASWQI